MLWAVRHCGERRRVTPIRDNNHIHARSDMIDPAVQNGTWGHVQAQFLVNFSRDTILRAFSQFQLPSGQLPLLTLILEQHHALGVQHYTLHGHREAVGLVVLRKRYRGMQGTSPRSGHNGMDLTEDTGPRPPRTVCTVRPWRPLTNR